MIDDDTLFAIELEAEGIPADSFCGRTFTGMAAICPDAEELVRAIRATTGPVQFEELPAGGWLLFPTSRVMKRELIPA